MTCRIDDSPMVEDTEFARQAFIEGIRVRRFYGVVCGHSVYDPPTLEGRGWTPRPAASPRRCDRCATPMPPHVGRGVRPRRCRACRGLPETCVECGAALTSGTRITCSDACLHASGRRALAALPRRSA